MVTLDRMIVIERLAADRDAFGDRLANAPVAESEVVWAKRDDREARDGLMSGREDTELATTYTVRWREGLDNRWRVRDGEVVYRVAGVLERGRRRYLDVLCEVVS